MRGDEDSLVVLERPVRGGKLTKLLTSAEAFEDFRVQREGEVLVIRFAGEEIRITIEEFSTLLGDLIDSLPREEVIPFLKRVGLSETTLKVAEAHGYEVVE